jgi:hypothetical protein
MAEHPTRKETKTMRKTIIAALILASALAATPALADTTWTGNNLVLNGGTTNGCNITKVSASHTGSDLSEMRVILRNRGSRTVRISGDTELSGQGQRKTNSLGSVQIAPGQTGTTTAGYIFGGSLAGTTLRINITACQVVTP